MIIQARIFTWSATILGAIPAIELVASVDQVVDIDNPEGGRVPCQ